MVFPNVLKISDFRVPRCFILVPESFFSFVWQIFFFVHLDFPVPYFFFPWISQEALLKKVAAISVAYYLLLCSAGNKHQCFTLFFSLLPLCLHLLHPLALVLSPSRLNVKHGSHHQEDWPLQEREDLASFASCHFSVAGEGAAEEHTFKIAGRHRKTL